MRLRRKPILIGISGGTGSGKTTLAETLQAKIGKADCHIISQDSYYKDRSPMEFLNREKLNFDEPAAFDLSLLIEHLKKLKAGKAVEVPIYDYKSHTRKKGRGRKILSQGFIIFEGILLFAAKGIRSLFDLKIYIEASPEVRFQRRLERDIKERGRSEESVKKQYQATVLPMHLKYIEPSRQFADIVVSGEEPTEESWQKIEAKLKGYF